MCGCKVCERNPLTTYCCERVFVCLGGSAILVAMFNKTFYRFVYSFVIVLAVVLLLILIVGSTDGVE